VLGVGIAPKQGRNPWASLCSLTGLSSARPGLPPLRRRHGPSRFPCRPRRVPMFRPCATQREWFASRWTTRLQGSPPRRKCRCSRRPDRYESLGNRHASGSIGSSAHSTVRWAIGSRLPGGNPTAIHGGAPRHRGRPTRTRDEQERCSTVRQERGRLERRGASVRVRERPGGVAVRLSARCW
jgi:hypothetical protein